MALRFAQENLTWGYDRIQGALANVGFHISDTTVGNILKAHGIEPAPDRQCRTAWSTFLEAHWDTISAAWFLNGSRLRFRCSYARKPFYPKDPLHHRIFSPYGNLVVFAVCEPCQASPALTSSKETSLSSTLTLATRRKGNQLPLILAGVGRRSIHESASRT